MVQIYDPESAQVRACAWPVSGVKLGLVSEALEQQSLRFPKILNWWMLVFCWADCIWSLKQYARAVSQYEEVLKKDPNNTEAPMYLGAVYAEQKQFDKSVRFFESLAKNEDYSTPYLAYYYVGRVRLDQDGLAAKKAAEAAFKKLLSSSPRMRSLFLPLDRFTQRRAKRSVQFRFTKPSARAGAQR